MNTANMLQIENVKFKNVSYLYARDPSILAFNRQGLDNVRVCLAQNMLLEESNYKKQETDVVQVLLRIKGGVPFENIYEIKENSLVCKIPQGSHALRNIREGDNVVKTFTFSKIFGPDTTQNDIFNSVVKAKMLDFINGKNCTLLTYGASGSGKTFTIVGTPEEPGLIPRALEYIFRTIPKLKENPKLMPLPNGEVKYLDPSTYAEEKIKRSRIINASHADRYNHIKTYKQMQQRLSNEPVAFINDLSDVSVSIWVSVAEIYNENIYDLLQPPPKRGQQRPRLRLGNYEDNNFIKDLTTVNVSSGIDAYQVLQYGINNLNYAATSINSHSSRSHCIFTIKLIQSSEVEDGVHVSSFNFCDLAGSERLKKTHNVGDRLKESNNINTSLLVLGRCISQIRSAQQLNDNRLVPFRESKLTQLFQKALTGHEDISMIVNINPSLDMFDESQHVLNFSAVAKELLVIEQPLKILKPRKKNRFSEYMEKKATPQKLDKVEELAEINDEKDQEIIRLKEVVTQLYSDLENQKLDQEVSEQLLREYMIGEYKIFIRNLLKEQDEEKERAVNLIKLEYEERIKNLNKPHETVVYCLDSDEDTDSEIEEYKKTIQNLQNDLKKKDETLLLLKQELYQLKRDNEDAQKEILNQNKKHMMRVKELECTLTDAETLYKDCLDVLELQRAENKKLKAAEIDLMDTIDVLNLLLSQRNHSSDTMEND